MKTSTSLYFSFRLLTVIGVKWETFVTVNFATSVHLMLLNKWKLNWSTRNHPNIYVSWIVCSHTNCLLMFFHVLSLQIPSGPPQVTGPMQENPSIFQKLKNAFSRDSGSPTQVSPGNKAPGNLLRPMSRVDSILGRLPAFLAKDDDAYIRYRKYFSKVCLSFQNNKKNSNIIQK